MSNLPIIRLEVERMKFSMLTALTEYASKMDENIQQAVENYCTPENLKTVVMKAATDALDAAIKEEVREFFSRGQAGRQAVREAVICWLDEVYPTNKDA